MKRAVVFWLTIAFVLAKFPTFEAKETSPRPIHNLQKWVSSVSVRGNATTQLVIDPVIKQKFAERMFEAVEKPMHLVEIMYKTRKDTVGVLSPAYPIGFKHRDNTFRLHCRLLDNW